MHHVDANKCMVNNLHKNVTCHFEQILEATRHKIAAVRPLTSDLTKYVGHSWRSNDELINDIFLHTPRHRRVSICRPARSYISYLRTLNVLRKTCQKRWLLGMDREGERQGNAYGQRDLMKRGLWWDNLILKSFTINIRLAELLLNKQR